MEFILNNNSKFEVKREKKSSKKVSKKKWKTFMKTEISEEKWISFLKKHAKELVEEWSKDQWSIYWENDRDIKAFIGTEGPKVLMKAWQRHMKKLSPVRILTIEIKGNCR